jgi:presequence protease
MPAKDQFRLLNQTIITEYSSEIKLFEHIKSGARVMFVENDDTNKVFGVSFRTPVSDSTGVPHILEHSVLNGSQKYPVKEPFVNLVKSSLNTFLNAMTYPDRTIYPVASQNKKDLYNLANVYMDAVFFPNLKKETFKQEGWHYELDAVDQPITYKGVVFNEMKGGYSDPDNTYVDYIIHLLNPDNSYAHESGGDPAKIPSLSYEQFKDFHTTYYHPSNCLVYMYGDDHSDERFELIDAYLSKFDKKTVNSAIATQPILDDLPPALAHFDPGEDLSEKGYISVNWVLPEYKKTLAFSILDKVLSGSPTSPMYKALIESGLGEDAVPFFGFELDLKQPLVGYGLKGVLPEHQQKVIDLIYKTLDDIVANGLNSKDIEAALNSTEFYLREYETGRYPKGLAMMLSTIVDWVYDRDYLHTLSFEQDFADLRSQIAANPRYFEDLITKELLDNPHKLEFRYLPEPHHNKSIEDQESRELAAYKASLTQTDLENLASETATFKQSQLTKDTPEELACLPTLTFEDLKGAPEKLPIEKIDGDRVPIYYHNIDTNGVVYLDLGFDLSVLPAKLYPYLSIYTRLFTELDTDTHTAGEINQLLDLHTGNFSPTILNTETVDSGIVRYLFLRGKVLVGNTHHLFDLWTEVIQTISLDNKDKIKQIFVDTKAAMETDLISSARSFGVSAINSSISKVGDFDEMTGGYRFLEWLRGVIDGFDANWEVILSDLNQIKELLFAKNVMILNVTCLQDEYGIIKPTITYFINNFDTKTPTPTPLSIDQYATKSVFLIPTKVNSVSYGVNLKQSSDSFSGAMDVVINHLNFDYLWSKVRAQGGAYGSIASLDKISGCFTVWSYRDPRFEGTMEDYRNISTYLRSVELSKDQLLTSVIGSIGTFDRYLNPRQKGWVSLIRTLTGRTDEQLAMIRDQILETQNTDFHLLGNLLESSFESGKWAIFSSQTSFEGVTDKNSYDVIKPL